MEGKKYETFGGIRSKNGKLYLVEFTNKETGEQFLKFGVTSSYDVMVRFEGEEYEKWTIRPLASAYGTKDQVEEAERYFLSKYPKNLWVNEKFRGVTEIVQLDKQTRNNAIKEVRELSSKLKNMRMLNENKS